MKLKIGEHCLLRVPGTNDRVGIFLGKYEGAKTHVKVDVKFHIGRDWKKYTKPDEPHTYLARRQWVFPYPVVKGG